MELRGHKYKTRMYWLDCDKHASCFVNDFKIDHYFESDFDEFIIDKMSSEVFHDLKNKDFSNYSCVCIEVNFCCNCEMDPTFMGAFLCMKHNKSLRYVTKIVMYHYYVKVQKFATGDELFHVPFDEFTCYGRKITLLGPGIPITYSIKVTEDKPNKQKSVAYMNFFDQLNQKTSKMRKKWRLFFQNVAPIDNLIFMQLGVTDHWRDNLDACNIETLHLLCKSDKDSVQHTMEYAVNSDKVATTTYRYRLNSGKEYDNILFSSTSCNYFYVINPALAIVMNHLTFSDESLNTRKSSRNDLMQLKKTFDKLKIPQLIIYDGTSEDVKCVMTKVQTLNMSVLKFLFIIVMSHGTEGDIIETRTKSYHVYKDIVEHLRLNPTLKNTQIFVMVNACRGDYDPQFAMVDDSAPENEQSDTSKLEKNLIIWFSTQKGYVSYLPKTGSWFIQEFCKDLENLEKTVSMKRMALGIEKQINKNLKHLKQIPEYLSHPETDHTFQVLIENLIKYNRLLDKLEKFTKFRPLDHQAEKSREMLIGNH